MARERGSLRDRNHYFFLVETALGLLAKRGQEGALTPAAALGGSALGRRLEMQSGTRRTAPAVTVEYNSHPCVLFVLGSRRRRATDAPAAARA